MTDKSFPFRSAWHCAICKSEFLSKDTGDEIDFQSIAKEGDYQSIICDSCYDELGEGEVKSS